MAEGELCYRPVRYLREGRGRLYPFERRLSFFTSPTFFHWICYCQCFDFVPLRVSFLCYWNSETAHSFSYSNVAYFCRRMMISWKQTFLSQCSKLPFCGWLSLSAVRKFNPLNPSSPGKIKALKVSPLTNLEHTGEKEVPNNDIWLW